MAIAELLSRLRKVKPAGAGKWMACCPAHEDRKPSLSLRVVEDGRVLVHCFSGCGAADVVSAVGLEYADIGPDLPDHRYAPVRQPFTAADALRALSAESGVIAIAVADIADGRQFCEADVERINLAAGRITTALEYVYGSR